MSETTSTATHFSAAMDLAGTMPLTGHKPRTRKATQKATWSAEEQLLALRPMNRPDWVDEIQPLVLPSDGTNGLHRLVGMWPGDETDEEVERLLGQIDDEDAGRW